MQSIHSDEQYEEECKEQFRNMTYNVTDEQTGQHIGLEKVRNIVEGVDENYGIDTIRKLVEKIKKEQEEADRKTFGMWHWVTWWKTALLKMIK